MSDPRPTEREFLLRSLEDLEREHDAGDLDDADYTALKDDYTARAAAALRAEPAAAPPSTARQPRVARARRRARPSRRWPACWWRRRRVAATPATPRRAASTSRSPRSSTRPAGASARATPTAPSSSTTRCSTSSRPTPRPSPTRAGRPTSCWATPRPALTTLIEAATADRDYPDVHAFLAVLFFRSGLVQQASNELDRLDALDPPPDVLAQIEGLRAQVDAALAALAHVDHRRADRQAGGGR